MCQEGRVPTINAVMMQGPDMVFRATGKGREGERKKEIEREGGECVTDTRQRETETQIRETHSNTKKECRGMELKD